MSRLRNLIEAIPTLAKCVDADRFADRNLMVFDKEIADSNSVYAHREGDVEGNRIAVLAIPPDFIVDQKAYDCAMARVEISMLSYDKSKGRISTQQAVALDRLIADSEARLIAEDSAELAVEEIITLEVSTRDVW